MAEKRLAEDQVPPGTGSSGGDMVYTPVVSVTSGLFTTSSGTFVDVTGAAVTVDLPIARTVKVVAQFVGMRDAADTDIAAFIAMQADGGADVPVGEWKLSLAGGFNGHWIFTATTFFNLTAGLHTIKLRAHSNGANNIRIKNDTTSPTRIWAEYFDPTVIVPDPAVPIYQKAMVINTTAGEVATTGSVTDLPGMSVTFNARAGSAIEIKFSALYRLAGQSPNQVHVVVNIDGSDAYDYYILDESSGDGCNDHNFRHMATIICAKQGLSAGSHTVKIRQYEVAAGTDAFFTASPGAPATLIVDYIPL